MKISRRVAFLATLLAALTLACTASAATITVTTTADELTPNDGSVSLREAMTAINAGNDLGDPDITAQNPGTFGSNDTIDFNIPGAGPHRILVGGGSVIGALPALVKPVLIDGTSQTGASVNTLANGDNASTLILLDGSSAGPNASGLFLHASSSTIEGLAVFGFGAGDIAIQSSSNTIVGDDLGLDPSEAPALSPRGVLIQNASNNTIGGTTPAARNVISGNLIDGVEILGSIALPATGNVVQGNFIGTGQTGVSALGNGDGAAPGAGGGVQLIGADNNTIGGTLAGARNVISGNAVAGVLGSGAQNNLIQGNFLGVGADGVTAVPNATGVWLTSTNAGGAAQNNQIGGTVAGSGNLIAFNSGAGVILSGTATTGDGILGNSIFANGGLGIDLGDDGVTPNAPGGPHTGPNLLQNFPLITAMSPGQSTTTIQGTLNATPAMTFRLEFFSSPACDPSGFGEGQTFLGFTNVTTDASGSTSYSAPLAVVVPATASVAATATDPAGNTSELSPCFPPAVSPTVGPTTTTTTPASPPPPLTVTPPHVTLSVAKTQKDGSITLNGATTVAGRISALGTLGSKGSAAASRLHHKRPKPPTAQFGPAGKLLAGGSFTLNLKPNSTALAQLRKGKRLTVIVTLTLSPTAGGGPLSSTAKVSDRLAPKHRVHRR